MTLAPEQVLQNRYRILSLLGQGGMGAVYRAQDTRLNISVALKEMTPQPGLDQSTLDQLRRQFQQEAETLARMNHPHLVRVIDFFEEGRNAYLVMNFVAGNSLADLIAQQAVLDEPQVIVWAQQILDALAYCHEQNVIHRDIKPQNIIIGSDGRIMLVDFGLVKLWDPDDPHTQTAMRGIGTPGYAPPEQYGIQPGHTDPRSDIYSLGATLYHALTGQAPPSAGDRMANPDLFTPLWQLNPYVSVQTEAAVMQAMALPLAERFQGARQMAAALRETQVASEAPTRIQPADASAEAYVQPAASQPRRRSFKWGWGLAGVGVLAVLGVGVTIVLLLLVVGGLNRIAGIRDGTPTMEVAETPISTPAEGALPGLATDVPPTAIPLADSLLIRPDNVAQVSELVRWGKGSVEQVTYTPDGQLIAVASSLGVYLYDAETWQQVRFIEPGGWVHDVAFSPDGEMLVAGLQDGRVQLWRTADGTLVRTLGTHEFSVVGVAFSPNGRWVASGSWDKTVRVWGVEGDLLYTLEGHTEAVRGVAFSPDGRFVASASRDGTARLWRMEDGESLVEMQGHEGDVNDVAFSPDASLLASAGADGAVRVWTVPDGQLRHTLQAGTWGVSAAFSPDGEALAVGLWNEVQLWRVSDGERLNTLEAPMERVESIGFSPEGDRLVAASSQGVYLWHVSRAHLLHTLEGYRARLADADLSRNGKLLAIATGDGVAQVWQASDGELVFATDGEGVNTLKAIALSPDSAFLALTAWDEIHLWAMGDSSRRRLGEIEGDASLRAIVFSPDGDALASGWSDGSLHLWQVSDGGRIFVLEGHTDDVTDVAYSPDGAFLASASWDDTARIWHTSDGTLAHTLNEHSSWVTSVAFSPDSSLLATGSWDDSVRLWHVSNGKSVRVLEGHEDDVEAVAFSADGSLLACASDTFIYLWQVSNGARLRILEGHTGHVQDVFFSADGRWLISMAQDGTVRMWGVPQP